MTVAGSSRTRSFSWDDPAPMALAGAELRGIEYLRAIASGSLPPPPIARLLDFSIVEVDHGRVVFALDPAEWMYNPIGSVHGGVAADSCMGCAVHSTLAAGIGYDGLPDPPLRAVQPLLDDRPECCGNRRRADTRPSRSRPFLRRAGRS